jgi:hypothetical protein
MDAFLMHGFEDVTLSWAGRDYVIPANRQMRLIAMVEDALSSGTGRQAIGILMQAEGPSYSRLAGAFGTALRYAGAPVSDDEIYLAIMQDFADGDHAESTRKIQAAVLSLLTLIAPPIAAEMTKTAARDEKADDEKKT